MELHAKYTFFAEGCRGHLGRQLIARFKLDDGRDPQSYGIGLKELWEVDAATSTSRASWCTPPAGRSTPTPTAARSSTTSTDNQVAVGFVVGLDYANPYLSPFEEFQRYKTHPAIRTFLEGGKRLGYGARAITAGGILQSLPKLVFPGGALRRLRRGLPQRRAHQGQPRRDQVRHARRRGGLRRARRRPRSATSSPPIPAAFEQSWLHDELHRARNFKPWFKKGLLRRHADGRHRPVAAVRPARRRWTLHRKQADHEYLKPAAECEPIAYPKPDGVLTFDRLSSVFVSNTNHDEDQPAHLTLKDAGVPVHVNLRATTARRAATARPASTSSSSDADGTERLQINAQNCVHCKTCDIKDPTQNIVWVTPEGGGGPNYVGM